jgi:metallophosphoesterase superfamily enzyme
MKLINKAVYLEKEGILVISDLHIGYEEVMGTMPRSQFQEIIKDLNLIFNYIREEIKEIIILGDLKHEFSRNINQEWNEVRKFFSFLREKIGNNKIVLIKGNHDKFIEIIASKYDIETRDYYIKNDRAFFHGDKQIFIDKNSVNNNYGTMEGRKARENGEINLDNCSPNANNLNSNEQNIDLTKQNSKKIEIMKAKNIKTLFLGHLHPAIRLEENAKREIYKCFLVGKYKPKEIVILPSFFPLIEGSDVLKEETNLAYEFNLDNFEVYIPDEIKVLNFGKLKTIGRLS